MGKITAIILSLFCSWSAFSQADFVTLATEPRVAGGGGIDWLTYTNNILQFYDANVHSSSNNGATLNFWTNRVPTAEVMAATGGGGYVTNSVLDSKSAIAFQDAGYYRTAENISHTQPHTQFIVIDLRDNSEFQIFNGYDATTVMEMFNNAANDLRANDGASMTPGFTTPSGFFLLTTVFNGASSRMRLNDGTASTGDAGAGTSGSHRFVLGEYGTPPLGLPVNGWIACYIEFNAALSTTDETTVRDLIHVQYPSLW